MAENSSIISFLAGKCDTALFEPFISGIHTETLIWRRGIRLWDTAEHYIDTLESLEERTKSGTIFPDAILYNSEELENAIICRRRKELSVCMICRNANDIAMAEKCADAAAVFGDICSVLPTVRMDGSPEEAVKRGDCAWMCRCNPEYYLEQYGDRIKIAGGIIIKPDSSPAQIYEQIEKLTSKYKGTWAVGSDGNIAENSYLGLIAMLGAYLRQI